MINMPKIGENVNFKNYERKITWQFMINADFESILVPDNNGKQNPGKSSTKISKTYCLQLWL